MIDFDVMTIKQIYNLALEMGINADPRGKKGIVKSLILEKKKYSKLSKDEREFFDKERLTNPYSDSRIHFGNPNNQVKTILVGIDIEAGEIALVTSLQSSAIRLPTSVKHGSRKSEVGKLPKIDLIINHHPEGKALAALDDVMHLQADLMAAYGVPINVAEGVMKNRIEQVSRSIAPINHMRVIDAAKIAGIPMMNVHTPCDNLVFRFLQNLMDPPSPRLRRASRKQPETVGEIIEILRKIPEYKIAALNNAGPRIFAGAPENRAGKIVAFDITGGTEGAKEIYPELAKAGVGTVIGMHMKDENRDEAIKNHLNVVIAGHISSDSIGMNLFLDKLAAKNLPAGRQGIKIIPISGLIRVRRK